MNVNRKNVVIRTLVAVLLSLCIVHSMYVFLHLPQEQRVAVGQELKLHLDFPASLLENFSVYVQADNEQTLDFKDISLQNHCFTLGEGWPVAVKPGTVNLQVRLFGIIPIRNMVVDVVPEFKVVPGGQSIGVLLQSKGILVVGHSPIETDTGAVFPAQEAGMQVGDIIVRANGEDINNEELTAKMIDRTGRKGKLMHLRVRRGNRMIDIDVKPVYCTETSRYRIGLFIRDNAAGVGTLTFYDPSSEIFGALGHVVSNGGSEQIIDLRDGKIVESTVQGIQQGRKGYPGEKIGMFLHRGGLSGIIKKNTQYGIFGTLKEMPSDDSIYDKPIPVAFSGQIKEGPATMLTVVNGDEIEEFDIEIIRIMPHQKASGKGLIIRITDKRLLDLTGGIIQGMSGSPILQNGRLVGAVTHVFINEPTQGYGILAEWMLMESGMVQQDTARKIGVDFPGFLVKIV